jgi:hypothetical protein
MQSRRSVATMAAVAVFLVVLGVIWAFDTTVALVLSVITLVGFGGHLVYLRSTRRHG